MFGKTVFLPKQHPLPGSGLKNFVDSKNHTSTLLLNSQKFIKNNKQILE